MGFTDHEVAISQDTEVETFVQWTPYSYSETSVSCYYIDLLYFFLLADNPLLCDCKIFQLVQLGSKLSANITGRCNQPAVVKGIPIHAAQIAYKDCQKQEPQVPADENPEEPSIRLITAEVVLEDGTASAKLRWNLEGSGNFNKCEIQYQKSSAVTVAQAVDCPTGSGIMMTPLQDVPLGEVTVCLKLSSSENISTLKVSKCDKVVIVQNQSSLKTGKGEASADWATSGGARFVMPSFKAAMSSDTLLNVEWTAHNWTVKTGVDCRLTVQDHVGKIYNNIFNDLVRCQQGNREIKIAQWRRMERHFIICLDVIENAVSLNHKCIPLMRKSDRKKFSKVVKKYSAITKALIAVGCVIFAATLGLIIGIVRRKKRSKSPDAAEEEAGEETGLIRRGRSTETGSEEFGVEGGFLGELRKKQAADLLAGNPGEAERLLNEGKELVTGRSVGTVDGFLDEMKTLTSGRMGLVVDKIKEIVEESSSDDNSDDEEEDRPERPDRHRGHGHGHGHGRSRGQGRGRGFW